MKTLLALICGVLLTLGVVAVVGGGTRDVGAGLRWTAAPSARAPASAPTSPSEATPPGVTVVTAADVPVTSAPAVAPPPILAVDPAPAIAEANAAAPAACPVVPADLGPGAAATTGPVLAPPPQPAIAMAPMPAPIPAMPLAGQGMTAPMTAAPPVVAPPPAPADTAAASTIESLGPPPAAGLDPRPFAEAHWQGLEAIPKTPTIAQALKLPPDVDGVIIDDVTLPADLQGFRAGDLVTAVDGVPTPNLVAFIRATDRIRDQKRVVVDFVRGGAPQQLELVALLKRLGPANGETPPMIPPGARRPHRYMGPCLNCHRIGTTGNLAADQGDTLRNMPGPVRLSDPAPHRDRGACAACHPILPELRTPTPR